MPQADEGPIVHVLGSLTAGGAERFVAELLPELVRAGHPTALVCLVRSRDAASAFMLERLAQSEIEVREGPPGPVRLGAVVALGSALRALRPSIVHLHNLNTDSAHLLAQGLRPRRGYLGVRTIHSTELMLTPLVRLALRLNPIRGTIFCSAAAHERNAALVGGTQVTIPNGMRFDAPPRSEERSRMAKRALGLDAARCHFLCVGRMTGPAPSRAPKAHDALIEAWRRSGLGDSGAVLHLLGDGALRTALESLAAGDPSIRFQGVVGDVAHWLLAADCFVMPSRWEGMPLAAVEAIGAGLPCLFSRIAPLLELDPPAVWWCEAGDVESLAQALRAFRDQPRSPAPDEVLARRERFSIQHTARAYLDFYNRLRTSP